MSFHEEVLIFEHSINVEYYVNKIATVNVVINL